LLRLWTIGSREEFADRLNRGQHLLWIGSQLDHLEGSSTSQDERIRFLMFWLLFGVAFFSATQNKRVRENYILPRDLMGSNANVATMHISLDFTSQKWHAFDESLVWPPIF
jgi:hypothetical protein